MSRMFSSNRQQSEGSFLQTLLEKKHAEIADLFSEFDHENSGRAPVSRFQAFFENCGLDFARPVIQEELRVLDPNNDGVVEIADFSKVMAGDAAPFLQRALRRDLAVENFREFCEDLVKIYHEVAPLDVGELPDYIPALAEVDPELFSISICTVDGQQFSYGDIDEEFCMQAAVQPLLYCLGVEDLGKEVIDEYIGQEPSGDVYNAFALNDKGKPHSPMINTGGIILCSMIRPDVEAHDRFSFFQGGLRALAGGRPIHFNQPVYLSEKENSERNHALCYYMRGAGVRGLEGSKLEDSLDFFFQVGATQVDAATLAVMAGTLANGGKCPTTDTRVLQPQTVKNCLALLYSCGMYDFSGEWAFTVGVPAKSGISGALMVIIPNKLGICIYSPRVDQQGNSVRGIEFAHRLTKKFHYSIFDQMVGV